MMSSDNAVHIQPRASAQLPSLKMQRTVEIIVLGGMEQSRTVRTVYQANTSILWRLRIVDPANWPELISTGFDDEGSARSGLDDVVLLRAGTAVFDGWLDRLHEAAYAAGRYGTATPFSNGPGQLAAYPCAGAPSITLHDGKSFDQIAARVNRGSRLQMPKPGNCCVYLRRDYIADCLAPSQNLGDASHRWLHVLAADAFVHWSGAAAVEYGWTEPLGRIDSDAVTELVTHFHVDPAQPLRRNIEARSSGGAEPAMLLITHGWGGGTEKHVRDMATRLEQEGIRVLLLRAVGAGLAAGAVHGKRRF